MSEDIPLFRGNYVNISDQNNFIDIDMFQKEEERLLQVCCHGESTRTFSNMKSGMIQRLGKDVRSRL